MNNQKKLPILCLDFDGVLHSYQSGWQGAAIIPDAPVSGAVEFLHGAVERFQVAIYSSRSGQSGGIDAMRGWLTMWLLAVIEDRREAEHVLSLIQWPTEKPAAIVTIDDRAIQFTGEWPSLDEIADFKPWNKRPAPDSTRTGNEGTDTLAATLAEFQRRNGYHKREIEELLMEFGELLLSKVVPAPDSTRTGQGEAERPDGAIHNGREHLRRLGLYGFTANDGHALDHCEDYIGAQQCFEVMAEALSAHPAGQSAGSGAAKGWKLVPLELTDEMRDAAVKGSPADISYQDIDDLWPAVLAAAKAAPPASSGQEG